MLTRRAVLAASPAIAIASRARAQVPPSPVIKIGAIQDASGPYSYLGGTGSLACARQAIAEMAGQHGLQVELLTADHQNKPDIGASIVRQWLDNGVDALIEFNNSAVALAVNTLVRDRDKVMLANNVGSASLSGVNCTPNETHWTFDTAMLARVMGNALSDEGFDTWFFIRADYVFGRTLQDDTAAIVKARGGKVLGDVAVPVGSSDYASALLAAQSSGARMVALALAGADLTNCIKQSAEFGLGRNGQRLAALIIYEQDIRSLGVKAAQGVSLAQSYYWDVNDRTRAFAKRVAAGNGGMPPNMGQAGAYSAVLHYLKAAAALGPAAAKASGRATVARMKEIPIDDDVLSHASIRPDGRVVSDVYLLQVKTPAESKSDWDLLEVKATIGPDRAWRPMSEGGCPLVPS
jgi:branched-chain amino acid transport system substrate-binding protein